MVPDSLKLSPENFVISEVFTKSYNGKPLYYIFNIGNKNGVVLITGQNNVIPVLGYSFKSRYKETGHSPAYIDFMKYYEEQIIYAIENNIQSTDEIAEEWARLEKGEIDSQKSKQQVGPFTHFVATWNQDCYYNEECPECDDPDCRCGHTLVGCVAVAMGQVMKYHDYPDYGYGDT